ncbi:MAG: pyridoxine 5-phosphate synthase [Candidatus Tokpelaia sp. JSC188]|nr:MAG: pyridoxine 5-phosphate synthase [Candidatus Tokpelaia sp. JSC188]
MSIKLSVNLNAVAFLRNRRNLPWPNLINLSRIALDAGATGITVHPRPDERHIRFTDLADIRTLLNDEFSTCEFNIEGYPTERFLELVEKNKADQVTLVPDDPRQLTSDHGWNFEESAEFLDPIIKFLKKGGMRVSLFSNPVSYGLKIARTLGADRIEFYTGHYGKAWNDMAKQQEELTKLEEAAENARILGFKINAGHDLIISNLPLLIKKLPFLSEVSIGHGLIADALEYGMRTTVQHFLDVLAMSTIHANNEVN